MLAKRAVPALLVLAALACSRPHSSAKSETSVVATPNPNADPDRPLPSPIPEIVARVNGQPVTIRQILPLAKAQLDRLPTNVREQMAPSVLRSSLTRYVERELLLQESLARGLALEKRDVERNYDQARLEYPDDSAWSGFLKKQGSDPQTFRRELRSQLMVAKLIEQEVAAAAVSADDVRSFFEANRAAFTRGDALPPALDDVRSEVEAALREHRRQEIVQALVARLRAKAEIEFLL